MSFMVIAVAMLAAFCLQFLFQMVQMKSFNKFYTKLRKKGRDATSRFAKNVRWGTFPSVALGWRMTEESFLKDNKILSTLKLRASYGVTGQQDGIGNYNYLRSEEHTSELQSP